MLFLAQVANVDLFDGTTLFSSSKTLLDSSITIGVTADDVRAGQGAKLYANNFHSSKMELKLSDQMFKIDYIAKNMGTTTTIGGDAVTSESVVLTSGGAGVVVGTPVTTGTFKDIGWATLNGTEVIKDISFTGKAFTVAGGVSGETYCVKYFENDAAGKLVTVGANIVPSVVTAVLTANLFNGDPNDISSSNKIGKVTIQVPRLQLSGAQELTMSMTGLSQTDISGTALVADENCNDGYYATILQTKFDANWYDDVSYLAVDDADVTITHPGTHTLKVYAVYPNAAPVLKANSLFTFTSDVPTKATVASTGVVTSVTTGTTTIKIKITAKPAVEGAAYVTVA